MTVDEIKRNYSMKDILDRYGIRTRGYMCSCPFHGKDKKPSMKIFKDGYNCFTCGANGDIFSFVQQYENCDFKTAFLLLGGEYEKPSKTSQMALYHARKTREKREQEERKRKKKIKLNNKLIHATRELYQHCEPLSDDWWYYFDMYHIALIKDINYMRGGEKD